MSNVQHSPDGRSVPTQGTSFSVGRFSVENPVLVTILMCALMALGVISMLRLPQEQFAEVPFYWVNVIVPVPGVGAEDIESSVTIAVENAFQGMNNLKAVSSTTSEGLSVVRVEFDDGISKDEFRTLYQDVQARFAGVNLPDGVLEPLVDDFSSGDFLPVVEVVVSGDTDYHNLRTSAAMLRDRILSVPDVSGVDLVGDRERQILLTVDPARMAALGLSTGELARAIQDQNQSIPGGTLRSGSRDFLVRTLGTVGTVADFGDIIVRRGTGVSSGIARVADLATVTDGYDPEAPRSRFNSEEAISLKVTKVTGGSSVAVVDGTRKILASVQDSLPRNVNAVIFNDSTVQISASLSILVSNVALGLVLLILILWVFVGLRNALITALGIPVTFALTFIVLEALGETINTNTLFGLVLVVGMIVDHGIVIVENSYRFQHLGLTRHQAAIEGTNQVVWPVIAATATTVAAFLPLMLIPGTIGKFLRVIPLTVSIALIVSTFEALFFLPSHFADWGRDTAKEPGQWFNRIQEAYGRFLGRIYKVRGRILAGIAAVSILTFGLAGLLRLDLFSAEDFSYFTIEITMPTGTSLDRTDQVVQNFEDVLVPRIGKGEVTAVRTSIGSTSGGVGTSANSRVAQIVVDLAEQGEGRTRSIDVVMDDIRAASAWIIGADQITFRKAQNGPPVSPDLYYRLQGDSFTGLASASRDIRAYLNGIPGLRNVEDDFTPGSPELRVRINAERASALGVGTGTIGNYLRARFDGIRLGTWFSDNEEVELRMAFGNAGSYEDLEQSMIPTEDGRLIPFSSVASVEPGTSLGTIRRVEGAREIAIKAEASDEVDLRTVNAAMKTLWDGELQNKHPGVTFASGGALGDFSDLLVQILRVFLLGLFLIYLILGSQFKSYTQPFLIILSIPLAFVGVILYLLATGTPFSTTVLYAGVALAGIAVNDAIVLLDFINDLRRQGKAVADAVSEAALTRIRPILLTSLTTIAGLLPTALGIGGTSVVWGPMASTILFGLVFSTASALVVIPLLYGLLYDKARTRTSGNAEGGTVRAASASAKYLALGAVLVAGGLLLPHPATAQTALAYPVGESSGQTARAPVDDGTLQANLEALYKEWGLGGGETGLARLWPRLVDRLSASNATLTQLASATAMARAQLGSAREAQLPVLTINPPDATARYPLYSYTYADAGSVTSAGTILGKETVTQQWGAFVRLSQALPTAGSLKATVGASLSAVTSDPAGSPTTTWITSPSLAVAVDQPLFVNKNMLDVDLARRGLDRTALDLEGAEGSRATVLGDLGLQVLRLGAALHALREGAWVLEEQAVLARSALEQAERDLARGVSSRADVRRASLTLEKLTLSLVDIGQEMQDMEASLVKLGGRETFDLLGGKALVADLARAMAPLGILDLGPGSAVYQARLGADGAWQEAERKLRKARLDAQVGNQADAPRLGLSFGLTPTAGSSTEGLVESWGKVASNDVGPTWQIALTLSAGDVSFRTGRLASALQDEALAQARRALEEAEADFGRTWEAWKRRWLSLRTGLAVQVADYTLARSDLAEEEIRFRQGTSTEDNLRRRTTALYSAGFAVLQTLRDMEILSLEVGGPTAR